MKARNYVIFGLFIILSSVLVSAGSYLIKGNVIDGDTVISLNEDLIIKGGKIVSSGNPEIKLIPLSPTTSTLPSIPNNSPAKAGVKIGDDCEFFREQEVSLTGNYYCEGGDAIVSGEFIVKPE